MKTFTVEVTQVATVTQVEVRPRDGQRDSITVRRTVDTIANILGVDVRIESEVSPATYHSYGMWRWGNGWIATQDPEARVA